MIMETVIATGIICAASTKRKAFDETTPYVVTGKSSIIQFRVPSGKTLEGKMLNEIQELAGVVDVKVTRRGDTFDVLVVMENTEFGPFEAVAQKKVNLYEDFPDYTFNFDFITAASLRQEQADMLAYHAA
jgi:hypothetical protein